MSEVSIITGLHNEQLGKLNMHFFRRNKIPSQILSSKVNNKNFRQLRSTKQLLQKSTGEHSAPVRMGDEMKIRTCQPLQLLVLY